MGFQTVHFPTRKITHPQTHPLPYTSANFRNYSTREWRSVMYPSPSLSHIHSLSLQPTPSATLGSIVGLSMAKKEKKLIYKRFIQFDSRGYKNNVNVEIHTYKYINAVVFAISSQSSFSMMFKACAIWNRNLFETCFFFTTK